MSGIYFGWPRQVFQFVNSLSPVISARPPAISVMPESDAAELDLRALGAACLCASIRGPRSAGSRSLTAGERPSAILMRRRNSPGLRIHGHGVLQSLQRRVYFHLAIRSEPKPRRLDHLVAGPFAFRTYWGLGVKIVWAAAGLAIPLLAVTGLLMYWNRALRRKWKRLRRSGNGDGCGLSRFFATLFIFAQCL